MTENMCEAENIFKRAEALRNYSSETTNDLKKVFKVLIAGGVIVGCTKMQAIEPKRNNP